ncbi:MAG: hypothetical protein ACI89L_000640 [Phycisphaerales bacterium]|jgi:hypothetical protein
MRTTTAVPIIAVAMWAGAPFAMAQPTSTPCFYQYVLGRANAGASVIRKTIVGDLLYAATSDGLSIFDVSSPASPVLIGQIETPQPALDVDVEGTVAYLACENSLQIVDVSDPSAPLPLGAYETDWGAYGVDSDGSIAVLANEVLGLFVFDVTDPTTPTLLGGLANDARPVKVRLVGSTAFLADRRGGLQIADLSDPTAPTQISRTPASLTSADVEVDGSMVYLAASLNGWVDRFDCTDLTTPTRLPGFDSPGRVEDLTLHNGLVYYTDHTGYLVALDPSSPTEMTVHSVYQLPYSLDSVSIHDGVAYVGNMHLVDITKPPHDPDLSNWNATSPVNDATIDESNRRAIVSHGNSGVTLTDLQDPMSIASLGSFDTPGHATGADFYGPYLIVADDYAGMQVIDATDPGSMSLVGNLPTPHNAWNVTVDDGLAYLSVFLNGMQIVSLTDPTNPAVIGSYDDVYRVYDIAVRGGIAYLAGGPQGLVIVDVSDPTQPQRLGSWDQLTDDVREVSLMGDVVLCDMEGKTVQAIDVSDPTQPTRIGRGYTQAGGSLDLRGDTLYVATGAGQCVHVVDYSDIANPTQVAVYFDNESIEGITVLDDVAYMRRVWGFKTADFSATCGPCPADINNDGIADFGDIQAFVQLFLVQDPAADANADGVVDFGDIQAFIAAFLAGC